MLRSAHCLRGFTVHAIDGDIGKLTTFLFDDEQWTIRYLGVKTGTWLSDRMVLVSPLSLGSVDWDAERIEVKLSQQQVENSPDIDIERPVSRHQEIEFFRYYNYPVYWGGPELLAGGMTPPYPGTVLPLVAPNLPAQETEREWAAPPEEKTASDPKLRSTHEVTGYRLHASDGAIGHVEDFIVDDENWAIRYIVVETRTWWPGKRVLVSPRWITDINWTERSVEAVLDRETIKKGPEFDPTCILDRQYEQELHQHYGQFPYWEREPQQ